MKIKAILITLICFYSISNQSFFYINYPAPTTQEQLKSQFINTTFSVAAMVASTLIVYSILKNSNNYENKNSNPWDIFYPGQIPETFDSIAGASEAKDALSDIVNFLKDPEMYSRLGARIPKGILLTGEPGTGKTLLARAVAGEANCTFISTSGSAFVEMYVGVGASRVRSLFDQARRYAPCIIFIDEIDAIGGKRNSDGSGAMKEHYQTLNELLVQMDGFNSKDEYYPVIVIAATNHEEGLDEALLRPGRFDQTINVPLPSMKERKEILQMFLDQKVYNENIDLEIIAKRTPGFSGAQLEQIVNQATLIATKQDLDAVDMQCLEDAIDLVVLGAPAKHIVLNDYEKRTTAYHESGHALINMLLPEAPNTLHGVTIIPRSRALGLTWSLPQDEKYSSNKEEMLARISIALAGRCAEEFMFNEISTGAHSDFESATKIARAMICHYGMSDTLGKCIHNYNNTSENIRHQIDSEVIKIIEEQYARVMKLLKDNKKLLIKLSEELLIKETMYAPEIYQLLGMKYCAQ